MRSKRIDLIEKYIYKHKTISIDKLCEEFKMSKNTIRRDIDTLVDRGVIKKFMVE
ncbi:DeoR/GlpR family transcriptional regulator of sugar metabolism [Clostridium beijerinckii]|nr:DeoR/GlpR family transcriptional regulator of sugar metabolism [Clostridium beijerinckii]